MRIRQIGLVIFKEAIARGMASTNNGIRLSKTSRWVIRSSVAIPTATGSTRCAGGRKADEPAVGRTSERHRELFVAGGGEEELEPLDPPLVVRVEDERGFAAEAGVVGGNPLALELHKERNGGGALLARHLRRLEVADDGIGHVAAVHVAFGRRPGLFLGLAHGAAEVVGEVA